MNNIYYKTVFSQICFLLFALQIRAQQFNISGRLSNGKESVPYASIGIYDTQEMTCQKYIQSDSTGHYHFTVNKTGTYFLKISAMGYKDFTSDRIEVDDKQKDYVVDIVMGTSSNEIEEISISAKKAKIETEGNKIVYNLQNSALSSGLTAFDLLKKLPGMSIGQDDNIQFKGSNGVNILLDGKMIYMSGSQIVNFLGGLNAEEVQKLEIINNPGAELDAMGNAGVINIVTKKKHKRGYAISLKSGISVGRFFMTNQNVSASLRTQKVDLYGSFDYNTPHRSRVGYSGNTIIENDRQLSLEREIDVPFKIKFYTWKVGADWQFLPKQKIGVFYHGYFDDFRGEKNSDIIKYTPERLVESRVSSLYQLKEPYYYQAINLNHHYDIDSLGKKLMTTAHYVSYRNHSDALMNSRHFNNNGNLTENNVLSSHQPMLINIRSIQTDADLPFRHFTLKAGVKYAVVNNDNNAFFDSLNGNSLVAASGLSNHFRYNEQVLAGYASGDYQRKQTHINLGVRLEHTHATSLLLNTGWEQQQKYTNIFPNLSIDQEIGTNHKIAVGISRRINRPTYANLNPIRWYNDEYFYFSGNPDLVPEMSWLYSATYTFKRKYTFFASYSQRKNYISERQMFDDNRVTVKSQATNFERMSRADFNITLPVSLFIFWEWQLGSGINYTSYPISFIEGDKEISRWGANINLQQQLKLPYSIKAEISTIYTSQELWGNYLKKKIFYTDIGLRKSFFNNKLDVQITISDIFNGVRVAAKSLSNITDYYFYDKPDSRRFGLTLRYNFGGDLINNNKKKTDEQERL